VSPDSRLELTPEQLYQLVVFLVAKGHGRAAADVMAAEFPRHHRALMAQLAEQAAGATGKAG
jgi:hypothetical protein